MRTGNLYCCLLIGILFLLIGSSCEKDGNKSPESIIQEKISGKWIVTGESIYSWFDFDDCGNYYISWSSSNVGHYSWGTYELKDSVTLDLSDMGYLTISSINDNVINFIWTRPNRSPMGISALKAGVLENTERTNLLCTTWKVVTINGVTYNHFFDSIGSQAIVTTWGRPDWNKEINTFRKDGTWYSHEPYDGHSDYTSHKKWLWNENETEICLAYEDDLWWNIEVVTQIIELTTKKLKVTYSYYDRDQKKVTITEVLQPYCNGK